MTPSDQHARAAVVAARASFGRLVAWLAREWRDISAAEDALSEAFAKALAVWPTQGVPHSPEGWLMTAAKRNLIDASRRLKRSQDPALTALLDTGAIAVETPEIPDHRLRLMCVCAHPAIDPAMRIALMLQTVLGLEAAQIARAFLMSPEAMAKRLTRAKAKIKANGIPFEEPEAEQLGQRVPAILEAIYGAYTLHADIGPDAESLAEEALYLASLTASALPECAEALGLRALLLFCEARKPGRLDASSRYLPLDRQEPARWRRSQIDEANHTLVRAADLGAPGPFQLEAAIQAAHCSRAVTDRTPWSDIVALYERLIAMAPTVGARLGHVIAMAEASDDAEVGLAYLDRQTDGALAAYQPWWAARAYLLRKAGRWPEAAEAYREAHALCRDDVVRAYLWNEMNSARGVFH